MPRTIRNPECPGCNGKGTVPVYGEPGFEDVEDCSKCDGKGRLPVVVTYDPPPVPSDAFNWSATFDDYEPGDPQGFGPTPEAAIAELLDQAE